MIVQRIGLAIVVLCMASGVTACSSPHAGDPRESITQNGLIVAQNPACATLGETVLRYLTDGDNRGDPSLDIEYADSVGVPLPQARAIADDAILECDSSGGSTGSDSATAMLNTAAVESGVSKILKENYGAKDISSINCPAQIPTAAGTTVDCSVIIAGNHHTVTLSIIDDAGTYEVSRPH